MATNRGKQFEQKLYENFMQSFPNGLIVRLNDQLSGYKVTSQNVSDFIAFNGQTLYFLEAKSVHEVSFSFTNLRQYELMLRYAHVQNVCPIVVIWFVNLDRVIAVPILTIKKMKQDGMKSFNLKNVNRERYYMIDIPSVKLRTFMNSDYCCLSSVLSSDEIENYGEVK